MFNAGWKKGGAILVKSETYRIETVSSDDYQGLLDLPQSGLAWECLFVLPFWLRTVRNHLGSLGEPCILSVYDGNRIIGVAPMTIHGHSASFLGSPDVCDYQDIVCVPGREAEVLDAVAAHLRGEGIRLLDLRTLHPGSFTLRALRKLGDRGTWKPTIEPDEVTYEAELPDGWEDYLLQLNGKQRHEVRRKLRRLDSQASFAYRMTGRDDDLQVATEQFLRLFQLNRKDKAEFMDAAMSAYFRDLIAALAEQEMLRLYFLELAGQPAATVLCFDYGQVRYLYNSGYDANYQDLSVGVLSKLLNIRAAIESGCRRYDFLKGAEVYKKRIGGRQVPLHRCKLEL